MKESTVRELQLSTYRTSTMFELPDSCKVIGVRAEKSSIYLLLLDTDDPTDPCVTPSKDKTFHAIKPYEIIDHKHPLVFVGQVLLGTQLCLVFEEKAPS